MIKKIKTMKTRLNQISDIAQEVEELRYAIGSMRADAIHAGDPVCEFNKLMIVFLREELSKKGDIYFWLNSLNTTLSLRGDKFGKYN